MTIPPGFASEVDWTDNVARQATFIKRDFIYDLVIELAQNVPGNIVEFGVADGGSTRLLQVALDRRGIKKRIFALDSFQGLREPYEKLPVGTFKQPVPDLPGIDVVAGYFEETCTPELAQKVQRVAFAHLDADLYSSTLCALRWLTPLLGPGSLLLFDEFIGEQMSEARAFEKWRAETGIVVIRIAEFDRIPSGNGDHPDRRPLFQVIS